MKCCTGDTVLYIPFRSWQEGEHKTHQVVVSFCLGFSAGPRQMDFKFYLTFIVEEKQEGNSRYSFWGRKQRREC